MPRSPNIQTHFEEVNQKAYYIQSNNRIIIIDDYRIVSFVPKKSQKWSEIVQSNLIQIKSEYIFTSKKAVVDFALGNSLDRITNEEKKLKNVRHKIGSKLYEHEYYIIYWFLKSV